MSHLNPERLAELADGVPTDAETAHLAQCAACAGERQAHAAVIELARHTGEHALPPLTSFEFLAEQLRLEGRISSGTPSKSRFVTTGWWMRAAAAVLLVVSGVAMGRWSATEQPVTPGAASENSVAVPDFATPEEARSTLVRAEREYRGALSWLAQNGGDATVLEGPDAYRARLAVLDELAGAARRGVDEAPYDPLLSQYYLSTLAARQATLQQLGGALPSGVRLTQF
ncbi:MAG TPA: hypothetical protein VMM77_07670 [Gemmatimonadaceae bacterium]|nr:hypothetical protein [Gemmatimonadaceae bacterium]